MPAADGDAGNVRQLEGQLAVCEARIFEMSTRLAVLGEGHALLVGELRRQLDSLVAERDDLARTVRMLRDKLTRVRASEPAIDASGLAPLRSRQHEVIERVAGLRVAGIMDEFTASTLAPSCDLLRVDATGWEEALAAFDPQLLFVESAWHGNGGQWTRKVSHPSAELHQLLDWCRERGVPTAFWNKEDPVHFDTFIHVARLFDHVFTTDLDCIGHYKTLLGHDRVHLLPFWGQPRLHNPVERYVRQAAFCFAGAYYVRYPERQRNFDTLIDTLSGLGAVEIFDRNHGKDDPNYMFPERYRPLIAGTLAYDEIDRAYSGYRFGINLNSVKQSPSMFARRVFDLLLSNTLVIGNYSRGVRLMFGELTVASDSGAQLAARLRPYLGEDEGAARNRHHLRLLALRKVMLEHTAEQRLAHVLSQVTGRPIAQELPAVVVVAQVRGEAELALILQAYDRQRWQHKRLVIVHADGFLPAHPIRRRDVSQLRARDAAVLLPADAWAGELVAFFNPCDFYAPHYLTDSALAFLYSRAEVVGKAAWYEDDGREVTLHGGDSQYRWQADIALRRAVAAASALGGSSLGDWLQDIGRARISGEACLAIDEFGYIANADSDRLGRLAEPDIDQGLPIDGLLRCAAAIPRGHLPTALSAGLDATALAPMFANSPAVRGLHFEAEVDALTLGSTLAPGQHRYVYADRALAPEELGHDGVVNLVATGNLDLDLVLLFLADDGSRIGQLIRPAGRNHRCVIPDGTLSIRLGMRVVGPGLARIHGVATRAMTDVMPVPEVARFRQLVLTNVYPSPEHLYRNAFVHRRVLGYRELGLRTDVFALNPRAARKHYEFEGIDVAVGASAEVASLLSGAGYDSVLVHFLDRAMWESLRPQLPNTRVVVWVHGAEVQPWYRRDFNYASDSEREAAKRASESRMGFWRQVMAEPHPNLHFVFVSAHFAEEVMEDVGVRLPAAQYSIIHNFIDTELFAYAPKPAAQRKKVLSIRPFASRKYANDLSVQAILALRDKPWFADVQFLIVGDGELFEQTVAPLQGLANVEVERRFLTQQEIAALHRQYGIFLCPTRMDSQGVSRDEAMSSGLVPVTSAVAAIPEFVDAQCGVLAGAEDWQGLAAGIAALVEDPARFQAMSAAAARRVRAQSGFDRTIRAEVELVRAGLEGQPGLP